MVFSDGRNPGDAVVSAPRIETVESVGEKSVVVAGDSFILTATYTRQGDDLLLTGADGREVLVRDFFAGDAPPDLLTEHGARVTGATAEILAGPLAPGQLAQAGPQLAQAAPIGRVEVVEGQATATHTDGTTVTLSQGAPVFTGDVVQTDAGGKLGLVFIDKTTFSMGDNARMVLNEMIYNPAGGQQSSVMTVLQGLFIFVTGEVGKLNPESVVINTPVATIGIRGTKGVIAEFSQVGGDLKVGCLNGTVTAQTGVGNPVDLAPGTTTTITSLNLPPLPPQPDPGFLAGPIVNDVNQGISLQLDRFTVDPNRRDNTGTGDQGGGGPGNEPGGGPGGVPGGSPEGGGSGDGQQGQNQARPPTDAEILALLNVQPGAGTVGGFTLPSLALASPFNAVPSLNLTSAITSTNLTGTTSFVSLPGGGFIGPSGTLFSSKGTIVGIVNTITSPGDTTIISSGPLIGSTQLVTNTFSGSTQTTTTNTTTTSTTTTTNTTTPTPTSPPPTTFAIATTEDTSLTITASVSALSAGGGPLTVSLAVQNGTLSLNDTTNLLAVDSDGSDGTLSYTGTLTDLNNSLSKGLIYTPNPNFNGNDPLAVTVSDGQNSNTVQSSITVLPVNDPPAAFGDQYATGENTVLNVAAAGIIGNDTDPDGDPLVVVAVNGQAAILGNAVKLAGGGSVIIQANGSFIFNPGTDFDFLAANQIANTAFTYTAADPSGVQSTATATITVTGTNDAPVVDLNGANGAGANFATTFTEGMGPVAVGDIDLTVSDVDNSTLVSATVTITNRLNGAAESLAANTAGTAINANFNAQTGVLSLTGADSIANYQQVLRSVTYDNSSQNPNTTARTVSVTVNDGAAGSAVATSTIGIVSVNQTPVAVADQFATGENTLLNVAAAAGVLANDTDVDGDPLTVVAVGGQAANVGQAIALAGGGSVTVQANGSFVFNPGAAFDFLPLGQAANTAFTYTVADPSGAQSTATATITVNGANDAPVAQADQFATSENTVLNVGLPGLLANDVDIDGNVLRVSSVAGQAANVGRPVALAGGGSVTVQADGSFIFNPGTDFDFLAGGQNGQTSFTYTVIDTVGAQSTATATITVNGVNDAPVVDLDLNDSSGNVGGNFATTFTEDGGPVKIGDVDLTVSDVDNGTLQSATVTITNRFDGAAETLAANTAGTAIIANYNALTGILSLTGADSIANYQQVLRSVTYDNSSQNPNPAGRTVQVTVNDGTAHSTPVFSSVTVVPVNDPPAAVADQYNTTENAILNVGSPGILGNDTDVEGDALSVTGGVFAGDNGGTFTLQSDGSFSFDPGTDFNDLTAGTSRDTKINYQAFDGNALSAPQTVTVTVNGLDSAPVVDLDANDSSGLAGGNYAASYTGGNLGVRIADTDILITDADSQTISSATITLTNPSTVIEFKGTITSVDAIGQQDIAVLNTFMVRLELDPTTVDDGNNPIGAQYQKSVKSITIFVPETGQTWTAVPSAASGLTRIFNDIDTGAGLLSDQVFSFSDNIAGPTIAGFSILALQVSFFDLETAPTIPGMISSQALITNVPLHDDDQNDSNLIAFTLSNGSPVRVNLGNLTPLGGSEGLQIVGNLPAGIVATTNTSGQIVLSGNASLADYQTAISQIQYQSSALAPSTGIKTIDVTVTDDSGVTSTTVQSQITVVSAGAGGANIFGSAGDDVLNGGVGNDMIDGLGGNDTIFGFDGDDTLSGSAGNDIIFGGPGNDIISGGDGDDNLSGFTGDDTVSGDAGNDILSWVNGDGNDRLAGGADFDQLIITGDNVQGNQWVLRKGLSEIQITQTNVALTLATLDVQSIEIIQLIGLDANDSLRILGSLAGTAPATGAIFFRGGLGDDALEASSTDNAIVANGEDGNDVLVAGSGNDVLTGGTGNDRLDGNDGADSISGNAGDDFLIGGDGDDVLLGGTGNDVLAGGPGNDFLDGGAGLDDVAVYFRASAGLNLSLVTNIAVIGSSTDQLSNIEHVVGTEFRDTIIGDAGSNELYGLGDSDIIQGGGGDDFLDGGLGFDSALYTDATSGITAEVLRGIVSGGGVGTDRLIGFNRIVGSDFIDLFRDAPQGWGAAMEGTAHEFEGRENNDIILGIGPTRAGYAGALNGVAVDLQTGIATDIGGASVGMDQLFNVSRARGSIFDDTFLSSTTGFNEFRPNDGIDTVTGQGAVVRVDYGISPGPVDVDLSLSRADNDGYGNTDQLVNVRDVVGSDNNDILRGDGGDNQLFGGLGNDVLAGRGGADLLSGGDGLDSASYTGAGGPITVDMTAGTVVLGGTTDTLVSVERVFGTTFGDTYIGGVTSGANTGVNRFRGGAGDDLITGSSTTVIDYSDATNVGVVVDITPGNIIDVSAAGLGTDSLLGNTAILGVTGSDFDDTLIGNDRDTSVPGSTVVIFTGNTLQGNAGNDVIDGAGGGVDFVTYFSSPNRVVVNLNANALPPSGTDPQVASETALDGFGTTDTLRNIEGVQGSAFDDIIIGNGAVDNLFRGLEGADFLDGGVDSFNNTAIYLGTASSPTLQGIVADLSAGTIVDNYGFTDTVVRVQNVIGSELDDVIRGDVSVNTLHGWDGNDLLIGDAGDDLLIGGQGTDRADYSAATAGIVANISTGIVSGDLSVGTDSLTEIEGIIGSDFDDNYAVTGAVAGNGNSTFNRFEGLGGNDLIAGNGNTALEYASASAGVTVTFTGSGTGTAIGDSSVGTDLFTGVNSVRGSIHSDIFIGNSGNESFRGRSGDDFLDGGAGTGDEADYRSGLAGVDADLQAGSADDGWGFVDTLINIENLRGGDYDDVLRGDGNSNQIIGNAGDDLIEGRGGNDLLFGNDGNDSFLGGAGDDVIDGGAGFDRIDYEDETASVTVDLGNGTATGNTIGTDTLLNIEHATGSAGADTLIGSSGANTLIGGDGNDTIVGGGGNDHIELGNGADTLVYTATTDGETITVGEIRGPSRTGDIVVDFTSGIDTVQLGRALTGGAAIAQGVNFTVIGNAFDGTLTAVQATASYNNNQATLVYSTADATLSYLQNGAASAAYTVLFSSQDPTVQLVATDLASA